ncbi:MAG TPA: ribosomal protein S18-alanine N-acetyltransferase [Sphingomicrobium sp.]|nr:ribosomal protein S18-alanine N-acetyltransferase [Sphingomicrobium sp.]
MTPCISSGDAEDLDSVMQVMGSAFPDRYGEAWTRSQCAGILPMAGVRLILARDSDGKIVGFSLYRTVVDDAELLLLAVRPEVQGQGIGRGLLRHFIDDSRTSGATRIHLEVRDGNPAVRVYKAAGFEEANRRRNYYRGRGGRQYDALTFVLTAKD